MLDVVASARASYVKDRGFDARSELVNAWVDIDNSVPILVSSDDDKIIEHVLGREKDDDVSECLGGYSQFCSHPCLF
ncbi:hypothetical protein AVEN_211834-1 [Araneus ventricosus]|uniref:Uncharacterized protein n=1 Tax=Araneus ventricosus TaxID=182803 RepID=A0A4Y2HHU5_ARAVE|nr:hypothetical protein AVEN_211834-1 [Araneus ventricosus]